MIGKLRLKFTLLVLVGLFCITGGVVFSINYANWSSLRQQSHSILQAISESGGRRPGQGRLPFQEMGGEGQETLPDTPPLLTEGERSFWDTNQPRDNAFGVDLSNCYTIRLDGEGGVTEWFSDRSDLYTDEEIQALAALVAGETADFGRLGSQFYLRTPLTEGVQVVVLDARMEVAAARRLLLTSALTGLVAYALMSLGAVVLIRRMTRPVQEAFDKQKQFVWDASHELKTPLAVISANAEVLAGEIGENEWLTYIQSEVHRTSTLVQNLLTLARMDGGQSGQQRQTFDLGHAVLTVALPFESAVFEAGKTLTLAVPQGISYTGNPEQIQQLVVILLSNAMKYADPAGVITLTLHVQGGRRLLRVHNTGPGIAPADLPHVFDRFYRADPARNREAMGSGLGLAIAKTIVEAHKGKIMVESQEGEWAAFTVTL